MKEEALQMPVYPREITVGVLFWGAAIAVPVLSIFAFREWLRYVRNELPRWRNLLGASSIGFTLLGWFGYAYIIVTSFTHLSRYHLPEVSFGVVAVLALGAVLSAVGWKGKARRRAITAACLLTAISAYFFIATAN
jgi:hypothetical protein